MKGLKSIYKIVDFKKCRKVIWGRVWFCIVLIGKSNIVLNFELKVLYRWWDGVNDKLRSIYFLVKDIWFKKGEWV